MLSSTVRSNDLYTLLMQYGVKFTSYRIKSVYKSLDQTVHMVHARKMHFLWQNTLLLCGRFNLYGTSQV